ncbi:MAG: hypothetical protein AAF889_04965 [Cyanobacteria bacterium P01_D01_bin.73]
MRYLAQVNQVDGGEQSTLRLLALQVTDSTWQVTDIKETEVNAPESKGFAHRQLVLVDMDGDEAIKGIADATDWVVGLVNNYLASGITPDFLKEEADRAEQWRQVLTLQTQDLSRRSLEMEARQEQLKGLDKMLQQGQQRLRDQWKTLVAQAEKMGLDTEELNAAMEAELDADAENAEED